jgi:hypothetical protein
MNPILESISQRKPLAPITILSIYLDILDIQIRIKLKYRKCYLTNNRKTN